MTEAEETEDPPARPLIVRGLFYRIVKGVILALGLLFFFGVLFLWWALRTSRAVDALREEILTTLHDACGVEATFSKLSLDPVAREVDLTDLEMRHLDGRPIVGVEEAIVQLELLPLFYGKLQLERVAVLGPVATIEIAGGKILNLPKCVEPPEDAPAQPLPIVLGVTELTVERGRIDLIARDEGGAFSARLADIGIALSEGRSGGADVAIGVDDGQLTVGKNERKLPLHRFRFLGHLAGALTDPRALAIDQLAVELGKIEVRGSGSIDLLGPVYQTKLEIEAPLDAIHDFVDGAPPVTGDVDLAVEVSGKLISPRGAGRIVLRGVSVDGIGIGDEIAVDFAGDRKEATLHRITGKLGDGRVEGKGKVTFDESFPVSVEAKGHNVSFGLLLHTLGLRNPWIDFRIMGAEVDLAGPLLPAPRLEGAVEATVQGLRVYDRGYAFPDRETIFSPCDLHATARWGFTAKGLTFSDGHAACGQTETFASASIDFSKDGGFEVIARLPRMSWDDLGPIAGLSFGGHGTVGGRLGGSYDVFGAEGVLAIDDISVGGIPFGSATGTIDWHDLVDLDFGQIQGRLGATRYRGEVGVHVEGDVPLAITGEIQEGRIEDVLVPFGVSAKEWGDAKGTVFARFDLEGPVTRLTGPIDLTLSEMEVAGERAERGRVQARMEAGRVVAEAIEIDKHGARLAASGFIDPNKGDVLLTARTQGARLSHLDVVKASLPNLDGDLAISVDVGGSIHGVTGSVAVDLAGARAGPFDLGAGHVRGKLAGATVTAGGALVHERLRVNGELQLLRGLPYKAKLVFDELPAPKIVAGLANHARYDGLAKGTARLNGSLVDWHLSNGKISLERAELRTPSFQIGTGAPARFTMNQGILETKRFTLAGPKTQLTFTGRFGSTLLELATTGRVDLALVELVSSSVEKAGGVLTLDGTIGGSFDDVDLVGSGRIEGGFLQWRGFVNRLTGVTADLVFSQSTVLVERARGRWAGGQLAMTGNVLLDSFAPKTLALSLDVTGVRPRFTYPKVDLTATLDGRLAIDGSLEHLVVHGDLGVRGGKLKPKISLISLAKTGALVDVYDPEAETVELDITLDGKEPIRMKNDEIDGELAGTIRITGTNERLGMLGIATLVKGGRIALIGPEYEIESGTIELRDRFRFDPKFDLVLLAEACDALIRAAVTGTLDTFNASYSSAPAMDQSDVVSCFLRGIRERDLDEDVGTFGASALIRLSGVDREVKKVLPVDQIDVSTEYSARARGYEPRVTIGKSLSVLDRSIHLEYSSSLVRREDQRAAARVRLTPGLNLELNWKQSLDVQQGDWGLDLKHRWEW